MQDQQQSGETPLAQTQPAPGPVGKAVSDRPVAQATKPTAPLGENEGHKPFADVIPHPKPTDPAALLDAIYQLFLRFMVMSVEQARAATLWVAMTWFIDVIKVAPLAIITAPERECGKSILLELFGRLVARPLSVANSSAAFLFRAIQAWTPTLLIDEADMFARQNDELKGLINAGHTRASAFVGRIVKVGDALEPQTFSVWSAKALAGIRLGEHLQDATKSRSVSFNLRRKRPEERTERLRHADSAEFELLVSKLARFSADYSKQVQQARPELPDQLGDRAADNWEALLAIAACAGPVWLEHARTAALALSAKATDSADIGTQLLANIRAIFEQKMEARISSADLLTALITDDPEAPWATHNLGKPLTARQLSAILAPYGIHSKTVRFGPAMPKGFEYAQFQDAFARYLPADPKVEAPREEKSTIESGGDWPDAPACEF